MLRSTHTEGESVLVISTGRMFIDRYICVQVCHSSVPVSNVQYDLAAFDCMTIWSVTLTCSHRSTVSLTRTTHAHTHTHAGACSKQSFNLAAYDYYNRISYHSVFNPIFDVQL